VTSLILILTGCTAGTQPATDSAPGVADHRLAWPGVVEGRAPQICHQASADHFVTGVSVLPSTGVLGRFEVAVTLSAPGHVQARCVTDDEPQDEHWAESTEPGTEHTLAFGGLLPTSDHQCQVTAVCPDATAEPMDFTLPWQQAVLLGLPQPTVQHHLERDMIGAYTLMSHYSAKELIGTHLVILDSEGEVRWTHALENVGVDLAVQWSDGRVVFGGGGFTGQTAVGMVDLAGQELYAGPPWDTIWDHHVELLDDGTLFGLALDAQQLGPDLHSGFQLVRWDPATDEVLWAWQSVQAVRAGQLTPDYAHANWATWVEEPDGPAVYVSLCELQQIIRVDVDTGAIAWTLGSSGDFALVDPDGQPLLLVDELPQCQHGVEVRGDRWLMMDNGRDRGESRGVELVLDQEARTATLAWTWTRTGWNTDILGDAVDLGDDHVLLVNGVTRALGARPWVAEIHVPTGDVVWEATFNNLDWIYRVQRLDGCELFANSRYCASLPESLRGGPAL